MTEKLQPTVAIVDYGICNMFSVQHACEAAGMRAWITSSFPEIAQADAIVLPGVGAFGDAMRALNKLDLIHPLKDLAASGKILFGVCLGFQLLMSESQEFEIYKGLGLIPGVVRKFVLPKDGAKTLKVPHVGWNRVLQPGNDRWRGSVLEGIPDGSYMYFCHSYYVEPEDKSVILTETDYGHYLFCSGISAGNITACQFHPEKSARAGAKIYSNLKKMILFQTKPY